MFSIFGRDGYASGESAAYHVQLRVITKIFLLQYFFLANHFVIVQVESETVLEREYSSSYEEDSFSCCLCVPALLW